MSTRLVKTRVFSLIITFVLALAFIAACEGSKTSGGDGYGTYNTGGNPSGGTVAPGSGGIVTNGGSGEAITTAGMSVGGTAAMGGGGGPNSGSGEPTVCEVAEPNCAGLSGCELTICVLVRGSDEGKIPGSCACLSGEQLEQCCAQVREGIQKYNCIDLLLPHYPECEIKVECPVDLIGSLNTNPSYPGVEALSQQCVDCLCTSCINEFDRLAKSDQSAVALLQCALSNKARKDCVVCNPPPCDTNLGTNMMTGPCSQELLGACDACSCGGPFDLNCFSLAGCMSETTVSTLPCRTAHMALECLATNCSACPVIPDCPSNFGSYL